MYKFWFTCNMKDGPLSNPNMVGNPYLGSKSSIIFLATICAISCFVGKVSVHPKKVSIKTRKYLSTNLPGLIFVKSTSQYVPGFFPRTQVHGFLGLETVLVTWQIWHLLTWSSIICRSFCIFVSECGRLSLFSTTFEGQDIWVVVFYCPLTSTTSYSDVSWKESLSMLILSECILVVKGLPELETG